MTDCKKLFSNLRNILFNPIKEEVKEVISLKPTEQDYDQGEKLAVIVTAVLAANGIPMSVNGTNIMGKALAFLVSDVKDGVDDTDKLLVGRIVSEIKKVR